MSDNLSYIRLDDLSVGYNGKALIRDICIDIKKGDIISLIGPNGAGKSTILKSITRQLSLIHGKVIFNEKNLHKMPFRELSKKMAVVLTERMKTDLLTCYDIVASGRYPYTGKLGILEYSWPVPSVRIRKSSCSMNQHHFWTSDTNWSCSRSFATWRRKKASR